MNGKQSYANANRGEAQASYISPMRDSIDAEIVPLLDSVVEVFGDEHDRAVAAG